ncbi:hypothetical protein RKD56_005471 [Priestia megaterium]
MPSNQLLEETKQKNEPLIKHVDQWFIFHFS